MAPWCPGREHPPVVEVLFVTQFHGYEYGQFLLTIPVGQGATVPLWVALGWGAIIWTSIQAGHRSGLPWPVRPAMDALLAVSLDIALDPVAEALGWWHWIRPGQFFGVPCDNFVGWVLIVGSYSLAIQAAFQRWPAGVHRWRDILIPVGALVPSVLVVAAAQQPLELAYVVVGEPFTLFVLCAVLLSLVAWSSGRASASGVPPWYLTGIPVVYHGLMLVMVLFAGVGVQVPELYVILPVAAIASLFGFRFPRSHHAHSET